MKQNKINITNELRLTELQAKQLAIKLYNIFPKLEPNYPPSLYIKDTDSVVTIEEKKRERKLYNIGWNSTRIKYHYEIAELIRSLKTPITINWDKELDNLDVHGIEEREKGLQFINREVNL